MEAKKNPRADIHQHRRKFFLIGLMISLSLVITAFEWRTALSDEVIVRKIDVPMETLALIPVTEINPPKVIAPPEIVKTKPSPISVVALDPINITTVPDNSQIESPTINANDPSSTITIKVEPEIDSSKFIFLVVEKKPEPIGGYENFYRVVSQNLKYPAQARKLGVEGKVSIDFVVDQFGNPTNIKVMKGIGAGCDEEAMRVVSIPKWNAGKQRGKAVNVKMGMQIHFKLN